MGSIEQVPDDHHSAGVFPWWFSTRGRFTPLIRFGVIALGENYSFSDAYGINDSGQMVRGYFYHGNCAVGLMSGQRRGVTEPERNNAEAVNNIGQITGVRDRYFRGHALHQAHPDL